MLEPLPQHPPRQPHPSPLPRSDPYPFQAARECECASKLACYSHPHCKCLLPCTEENMCLMCRKRKGHRCKCEDPISPPNSHLCSSDCLLVLVCGRCELFVPRERFELLLDKGKLAAAVARAAAVAIEAACIRTDRCPLHRSGNNQSYGYRSGWFLKCRCTGSLSLVVHSPSSQK